MGSAPEMTQAEGVPLLDWFTKMQPFAKAAAQPNN